jgi:hypothetical protein
VICTGTLLVLVGNPYQAGINSLAWTLCVQELWLSTSVTAGKLPVSLVAQCETMSDGPSRGTRNRRPILPQIVFMSNIEIEEEEWKPVEFEILELPQYAFLLYSKDPRLEVCLRIC